MFIFITKKIDYLNDYIFINLSIDVQLSNMVKRSKNLLIQIFFSGYYSFETVIDKLNFIICFFLNYVDTYLKINNFFS